jgi:hypothetical protein
VRRNLYGSESSPHMTHKVTVESAGSAFASMTGECHMETPEPLGIDPSTGGAGRKGGVDVGAGLNEETSEAHPSPPKSRRTLLAEMEMRGAVDAGDSHLPRAHLQEQGRALFMVRLYDVGMIGQAGHFNPSAPNPQELTATSSGETCSQLILFLNTHTHYQRVLSCRVWCVGVLVESRLLPETESTVAHELLLPLKQLRVLAEKSSAPGADSLCRKLRRLRCVERDRGELTSSLIDATTPILFDPLCRIVCINII